MQPNPYGHPVSSAPLFITEPQVAERLGVSTRTLRRWRANGTGPAWQYRGSSRFVMYPVAELEQWSLGDHES